MIPKRKGLALFVATILAIFVYAAKPESYANHDLVCIHKPSLRKDRMAELNALKFELVPSFVMLYETELDLCGVLDRSFASIMKMLCGPEAIISIIQENYNKILQNEKRLMRLKALEVRLDTVYISVSRSSPNKGIKTKSLNGHRHTEAIKKPRNGMRNYPRNIPNMWNILET